MAISHEFSGIYLADVCRNGQLHDHDVNKLLENAARTQVERYRDAHANSSGTTYVFLHMPCMPRAGLTGSSCALLHPCRPADSTLTTWGLTNPELRPLSVAELNSTGNVQPHDASEDVGGGEHF